MAFEALRRALVEAGVTPATSRPPASQGRREEATTRPARLIEGTRVQTFPVGEPTVCPEPLAFLDGIQRHQVLGYAGVRPLLAADVVAAVRLREGGGLRTAVLREEHLLLGRPAALARAGERARGRRCVPLPDDLPDHPVADLDQAVVAVDNARAALELEVAAAFRQESTAWLIVDGSLAQSPVLAQDPRALGVSKSHATLPFEGPDLETYLQVPAGHRTSIFSPETRRVAPVYAWGLRLREWVGRDLLFGLVRVEAAPTEETLERADCFSRWVLAERHPVSAPDARWDRLLYGIRNVEDFCRTRLA